MSEIDFITVLDELVGTEFKVGDGYFKFAEGEATLPNGNYRFTAEILDKDHNKLINLVTFGHIDSIDSGISEDANIASTNGTFTMNSEGDLKNMGKALGFHNASSIDEAEPKQEDFADKVVEVLKAWAEQTFTPSSRLTESLKDVALTFNERVLTPIKDEVLTFKEGLLASNKNG